MTRLRGISTTAISFAVTITIAAWFSLSNHCALGAAVSVPEPEASTSSCPMHSAPAKKKPATKTLCCKDLRALVAKIVTANPVAVRAIGTRDYLAEIIREPARVAIELGTLDTGPPDRLGFAEIVLQESMLSHAPPVS